VTNTNKELELLEQLLKEGRAASPEYAEMKRRLGWEFNGMRLHEYYFDNLGGHGAPRCGRPTGKEAGREFRQL
jgi:Fe-Mn family superoxide dismutase